MCIKTGSGELKYCFVTGYLTGSHPSERLELPGWYHIEFCCWRKFPNRETERNGKNEKLFGKSRDKKREERRIHSMPLGAPRRLFVLDGPEQEPDTCADLRCQTPGRPSFRRRVPARAHVICMLYSSLPFLTTRWPSMIL